MRPYLVLRGHFYLGIVLASWLCAGPVLAQDAATSDRSPAEVLTASQWESVNESVERALAWLASRQQPDGSFPTLQQGQPGVTSLCTLAYLAQGHLPGEGQYGVVLADSLDYVISCQKRSGLLASAAPNSSSISRKVGREIGITASYNHAIAGLVLCESYAMSGSKTAQELQPVIEKALKVSFTMHDWPKDRNIDFGGWRYLDDPHNVDSDLSITGWHLMFLRSAKNAGFEVDEARIERAIGYVRRCFDQDQRTFVYDLAYRRGRCSRAMAGAGILALAHSGLHHTPEAQQAGDWILISGFQDYNAAGKIPSSSSGGNRYFYGLLMCSQAMYQLGDRHWREFFPPTAAVLVKNQHVDGSWDREHYRNDQRWGTAYTTAIGVLALSASNQLLPIFQR